jgi:hypothetical protein
MRLTQFFIDANLVPLLPELGLAKTLPLAKPQSTRAEMGSQPGRVPATGPKSHDIRDVG